MRFPDGWRTTNSAGAVGAQAPDRQAQVFLEPDEPAPDATAAAKRYLAKLEEEGIEGVGVRAFVPVTVAGSPGARLEFEVGRVRAIMTFFSHGEHHYRITGVTPQFAAKRLRGRLLATMRSFRPLTPGQTQGIQATRLRVVEARSGEDMTTLCRRETCAWATGRLAVLNHLSITHRFNGGERVKIARKEDWTPPQP